MGRTLRSVFKTTVLAFSLAEVLVRFLWLRIQLGAKLNIARRAFWLHEACSLIARRLGFRQDCGGRIPQAGLVVSNHLSYLDILFYASAMPCVFVAKSDVRKWPVFGLLAQCGGTIFVERNRATGVSGATAQIAAALAAGIPVLLFPEGTSSDGSTVLPFYPSLLEPGVRSGATITAAAIRYTSDDCAERDLCYYGDITFGPHLLGALGRSGVRAEIQFDREAVVYPDRKSAALKNWERVVAMRSGKVPKLTNKQASSLMV